MSPRPRRLGGAIGGLALLALLCLAGPLAAAPAVPLAGAWAALPVKEVTVFKDGHALMLHEGRLPTDGDGHVVMDHLPTPVIGTFWPYAVGRDARLAGVVAGQRKVAFDQTALTLRELIEANVGAEVIVSEGGGAPYHAKIAAWPARSAEELETTSPPQAGPRLEQKGEVVLLETDEGTRVVNVAQITRLTFKGPYNTALHREDVRNRLSLRLDWGDAAPAVDAAVGMLYVQKGLRWIPSYKVSIDGKGRATVQLQATLLNELADLEDVTMHLVVGVPTFAFKETIDPISLQQAAAQLSPYFQSNAQTAYALSNAMMTQTQVARMTEVRPVEPGAPAGDGFDLGPDGPDAGRREDLYVFTVPGVTLRKGQRMVVPITSYELPYRSVYTLDLPFSPPPEVLGSLGNTQQTELARLFHAPRVMHKLRLSNQSRHPLTTAPALILHGERVLAQGMMTYAAAGGECDLEVTAAVNVRVAREEREVQRLPNAEHFDGHAYMRVDLAGSVTLTNYGDEPIDIEVKRHVLGLAGEATAGGTVTQLNWYEELPNLSAGAHPAWWHRHSWPAWWHRFNGLGRVTWNVRLEPAKTQELGYGWHYYWR